MSEQPESGAQPQWSADGQWWWDGEKWVAATQADAGALAMRPIAQHLPLQSGKQSKDEKKLAEDEKRRAKDETKRAEDERKAAERLPSKK